MGTPFAVSQPVDNGYVPGCVYELLSFDSEVILLVRLLKAR